MFATMEETFKERKETGSVFMESNGEEATSQWTRTWPKRQVEEEADHVQDLDHQKVEEEADHVQDGDHQKVEEVVQDHVQDRDHQKVEEVVQGHVQDHDHQRVEEESDLGRTMHVCSAPGKRQTVHPST